GLDHRTLDHLAAGRVDRVGDVRVQLGPAVGVTHRPVLVELVAATVAEPRPQVVLAAALAAPVGQLPARHGHERPLGALDDLQVAHDESIVERDRAEGLQPLVVLLDELDADFGDDHSGSPLYPWLLCRLSADGVRPERRRGLDFRADSRSRGRKPTQTQLLTRNTRGPG